MRDLSDLLGRLRNGSLDSVVLRYDHDLWIGQPDYQRTGGDQPASCSYFTPLPADRHPIPHANFSGMVKRITLLHRPECLGSKWVAVAQFHCGAESFPQ